MKLKVAFCTCSPPDFPQMVETLEINVDPHILIGDLRRQIQSKTVYKLTAFVYNGKNLRSEHSLENLNVVEGSTLFIVVE